MLKQIGISVILASDIRTVQKKFVIITMSAFVVLMQMIPLLHYVLSNKQTYQIL